MCISFVYICFFFFQAEDGIRDRNVTGVQTCALPIFEAAAITEDGFIIPTGSVGNSPIFVEKADHVIIELNLNAPRSEERRVGKECRSRLGIDRESKR